MSYFSDAQAEVRSPEAQQAALLGPGGRQISQPPEPRGGQLDRMTTIEDGLDDIGGKESEAQGLADVARIHLVAP